MINPQIFGKFILLERVSVGGMAEVYRAKLLNAPNFERYFAIKRILPNLAADSEFVTMFINEAKVAVELEHPNVCQIYELGRLGQSHYIAMEYIAGRDVHAIQNYYRHQKKIMSISQSCFIMAQAAQGLDYAHRAVDSNGNPLGLIHRDVSPQNLLVTYDGIVKLIDFGIAKASRSVSHSKSGVVKGKFSYMSPEQATDGNIDHRSDIFALGVIFWELLTGRRLFQSESEFAIMEMIANCDIPKPSQYNKLIPKAVEHICMKALEKDPNNRYTWASEMVIDLFDFINSCKTPFTQWHLQNFMCDAFKQELQEEWDKIPIFKAINTEQDVDKYIAEHASNPNAVSATSASQIQAIGELKTVDSDVISSNDISPNQSALPPIPGHNIPKPLPRSRPGEISKPIPRSKPGEISKSIPGVKSVAITSESDLNLKAGSDSAQNAKLDISSSDTSNDENIELTAEGIGPDVSDPQILAFKRAERKAKTRKSLVALIIVICSCFILSPILLISNIIELPKPTPNLPTSAVLNLNVVPQSDETHVSIYASPRQDDSQEIYSGDGSNFEIKDLQAGTYIIEVFMPDYETEQFSVTLENGTSDSRVELTHPLPVTVDYQVNVFPEDARLYINGILEPGTGATRNVFGIAGSTHTIRAFYPGFEPQTQLCTVNDDTSLEFRLTQEAPITISIQSDPPKSSVYIIDERGKAIKRGETPVTLENIQTDHPLQIEVKSGKQIWHQEVDFEQIETNDIKLFADLSEPEPAP